MTCNNSRQHTSHHILIFKACKRNNNTTPCKFHRLLFEVCLGASICQPSLEGKTFIVWDALLLEMPCIHPGEAAIKIGFDGDSQLYIHVTGPRAMCMRVNLAMCVYTYIHIYIYTYIHIYIDT